MPARPSSRDGALVSRLAAGDDDAWARLDHRHRPGLRRYAASLARPGTIDPDDVVQDVLVRAHRELRGGFAPDHLSAWLHRMVRNATIDALRAGARRPADALADRAVADPGGSPDVLILRRERLRRTIDDVARLPDAQRRALIARAVDDRPAGEVARELGISEPAVAMAVRRARENLMRTAEARDVDCDAIRPLLHDAHGRGVRPTETARLHLQGCTACRGYRRDLRRLDRRLRVLAPPLIPLLGVLGGGAATGVGAQSAAVVGTVALVAVSGGVLLVDQQHAGPGDPSPAHIDSYFVGKQNLQRGGRLPAGTFAVTAEVRIPAGVPARGTTRSVTLTCPAGTRTAQTLRLPGEEDLPRALLNGQSPGGGADQLGERGITTRMQPVRLARPVAFSVGVLCRRPDRDGSLVADPRPTRPGELAMVTVAGSHMVHYRAAGVMTGLLTGHEPVSVQAFSKNRVWAKIASDNRQIRGWILTKYLRPR